MANFQKLPVISFVKLHESLSDSKFIYWYVTKRQQELIDSGKVRIKILDVDTQNAPIWQHANNLEGNHDVKGIQDDWDDKKKMALIEGWFVSDDFTIPPGDDLEYLQGCIDNVVDEQTNHFHIADGQHRWIAWKTYKHRHTSTIPVLVGVKKEVETETYTIESGTDQKQQL